MKNIEYRMIENYIRQYNYDKNKLGMPKTIIKMDIRLIEMSIEKYKKLGGKRNTNKFEKIVKEAWKSL